MSGMELAVWGPVSQALVREHAKSVKCLLSLGQVAGPPILLPAQSLFLPLSLSSTLSVPTPASLCVHTRATACMQKSEDNLKC